MTPIERISEKSRALSVLNLPASSTLGDIRAAYKKLVLEKHPDQGAGTAQEFSEITDAYRFLKSHADELGIHDRPARVTSQMVRPSVKPTETEFTDDIIDECRSCFDGEEDEAHHVSTILHRIGRKLTYFVPTKPCNGVNDVVVPTGELVDTRHACPQVVEVNARDISGGVFDVPRELCETLFPGARSVKIRFAA